MMREPGPVHRIELWRNWPSPRRELDRLRLEQCRGATLGPDARSVTRAGPRNPCCPAFAEERNLLPVMPLLPNTRVKRGGVEQVGTCDGAEPLRHQLLRAQCQRRACGRVDVYRIELCRLHRKRPADARVRRFDHSTARTVERPRLTFSTKGSRLLQVSASANFGIRPDPFFRYSPEET
jgi:hypothetical protein